MKEIIRQNGKGTIGPIYLIQAQISQMHKDLDKDKSSILLIAKWRNYPCFM